jgi:hypothetical protein
MTTTCSKVFLLSNQGGGGIQKATSGRGPRKEVNVDSSDAVPSEFHIAGTLARIGRWLFLPLEVRYEGSGNHASGSLGKDPGFRCTDTGYIADGVYARERRLEVRRVDGYPAAMRHTARLHHGGTRWVGIPRNRSKGISLASSRMATRCAGSSARTRRLGVKVIPRSAKADTNAPEAAGATPGTDTRGLANIWPSRKPGENSTLIDYAAMYESAEQDRRLRKRAEILEALGLDEDDLDALLATVRAMVKQPKRAS